MIKIKSMEELLEILKKSATDTKELNKVKDHLDNKKINKKRLSGFACQLKDYEVRLPSQAYIMMMWQNILDPIMLQMMGIKENNDDM